MAESNRDREDEEEFYEAMPGTIDDDDWARDDYERNSILPWVLVAVVIVLLGLLLLGGLSLNNSTTGRVGGYQSVLM